MSFLLLLAGVNAQSYNNPDPKAHRNHNKNMLGVAIKTRKEKFSKPGQRLINNDEQKLNRLKKN